MMNLKIKTCPFWIIALLSISFGLFCPVWSSAAEIEFDTGMIKVISGRNNGGFIDEAYLDRNRDGVYSDNERIVLRPKDRPGLLVSYTALKKGTSRSGVAVGPVVRGTVTVNEARVEKLGAVIMGILDFGIYGSSPFEVRIHGRGKSAVLIVDFEFEPLKNSDNLLLREAALKVYGVFDKREPQHGIRSMSTGQFRNTPRPNGPQYPVWQYGGHLVESPWYWRNWVSWSRSTGPQTTREGHTPPKDLTFFMHDNFHGFQVALKEPANASPIELSGRGYPSTLSISAWTPRVEGLDLKASMPERFYIKEVALHFFRTGVESLAKQKHQYKKELDNVLTRSKQELLSIARPVVSNLTDTRISDKLFTERMNLITKMKARGWSANVAETDTTFSPAIKSISSPYGKNWLNVALDVPEGIIGSNVPAVGGLPFPKGVLDSVRHVRMIDRDGKEVACQVDRLATWPDGSIKWALLTAFVEISPNKEGEFRIEYGPNVVRSVMIPDKIEIQQNENGMQVSNGVMRFTIKKSGSGMFDTLWFDRNGDGIYTENEKVFNRESDIRRNRMDLATFEKPYDYGPYMYHVHDAEPERSAARVEKIEIERQGPLVAHIVVKGRYIYKTLGRNRDKNYENKGNEFWIRFAVFAGQSYLGIKHSYVFEGNPDLEMIQNLSLSATPNLGNSRIFSTAMDNKVHELIMQKPDSSAGIFQDNPYSSQLFRGE
jgi:hypothetical protein